MVVDHVLIFFSFFNFCHSCTVIVWLSASEDILLLCYFANFICCAIFCPYIRVHTSKEFFEPATRPYNDVVKDYFHPSSKTLKYAKSTSNSIWSDVF